MLIYKLIWKWWSGQEDRRAAVEVDALLLCLGKTCNWQWMLELVGQERKTHVNASELISFGAKLDSFSGFYCFVYIDLLQGK
jgi:hypothetical protein